MNTILRSRYLPVLGLVAAVAVVTPLISGNLAYLDTGLTIATTALIALSVGLCYGQAGILSVAQAAFAAIGAYSTAVLTTTYELPLVVGLLAAIILPPLVAFPVAYLVIRLSPLALVLATVVFSEIVYEAIILAEPVTGGFLGRAGLPGLPFDSPVETFLLAWTLVALVVVVIINVQNSAQGRAMRVLRTDPLLAQSLGISVTSRLAAIFALSAGIAGLAGWLYAHTRYFVAPESLPLELSLTAIMMAIVGGKTRALGPVVGTVALVLIFEVIPSDQAQGIFYGALLILALLFFPTGILGADSRSWVARLRPRIPMRSGGAR